MTRTGEGVAPISEFISTPASRPHVKLLRDVGSEPPVWDVMPRVSAPPQPAVRFRPQTALASESDLPSKFLSVP